jgi:serine protease Do
VVSVASTRAAQVESPAMPFPDDPFFRRFFGPEGEGSPFPMPPGEAPVQRGLGSGVLVAKDVILTNAHVVADAKEIVVTASDKRVLEAEVAGSDPKSDLAVLRIKSDTTGLSPLEFADSSSLALGQIVLAIGYPFGLGGTVTMGIVSAKGRADLGIVDYEDFLQTDAAINPGNSGGALIDLSGRLVGVPTAILSRSGGNMGVGFAIPSNMAKPIMSSLLEHGHVTRGFLGVTIQQLDTDLAQSLGISKTNGVLVSEVSPGSPAEKAGLRRGDVVVAVDGKQVASTGEFRNLIAAAGARSVELELLRDGKSVKTRAELREAPDEQPAKARADASPTSTPAGLRLAPLDATARERLGLPASVTSGVVVNAVAAGSLAAQAGLMPGDVILEVDKRPVASPQRFSEAWNSTKKPLALLIWRDGRTFFAVLKR